MKKRELLIGILIGMQVGLLSLVPNAFGADKSQLPPPPPPPPFLKPNRQGAQPINRPAVKPLESIDAPTDDTSSSESKDLLQNSSLPASPVSNPTSNPIFTPDTNIPHGQNLVSIDFPNGVNLTDIIKTIGVWAGKNFVLGQGVANNIKISIIAPEPMTKEEAYQTFLSALNISGFTTVETGKIVKILPIPTAKSTNIKTYYGANWAPETDEIINQVIPLRFIDAKSLLDQLRPILGLTTSVAFTSTNSIILTDTGFRVKSLLDVIQLLDGQKDQAQVEIIPINHMDAKDANQKITDIFGSKFGPSLNLQKSIVDERTNSIILIGPAKGLDDVVKFIKRIDTPTNFESQGLIRVRPLDYADAEKLAQTLQAFSQTQSKNAQSPFFPQRFPPFAPNQPQTPDANANTTTVADLSNVKIASDKSTNSLIIQGSKSAYAEIETLILALDKRKNQIYLEADILDLAVQNGLAWQPSALGGVSRNDSFLMPFGFNPLPASLFSLNNTGSTQDFQSALAAVSSQFLLGILSNTTVDLGGFKIKPGGLLFALKQDSNTNVLQTPSMMVADNETAKFNSTAQYRTVVNVPNPNGQGVVGSPQTYDVTTSLTVTPQISRADYINLKINLQLDDAGAADPTTGYPNPINKRSADSVVTLRSGQTAVMGGLTKESNKKSEAKIPLLGDIPILGWLFKIVKNEKIKSNLTLFLTPYVVKNSEDLARIYQKKLKDRDEFLKLYYGKNFKKQDFYKKLRNEQSGRAIPDKSSADVGPAVKPRDDIGKSRDDIGKPQDDTPESVAKQSRTLPSQNKDPIIAPSQQYPGGMTQQSPFAPPPPPPPPPPQTTPSVPPNLPVPFVTAQ